MNLDGYVRVSTDDQRKNGRSVDQQPARLLAYCQQFGHTPGEMIIDDGVSAGRPLANRVGGAHLIQRLRTGAADGVVVVHLDRLFRLASDGFLFFDRQVERDGVSVHSIEQAIDTSTPGGWLSMAMQLVAAEYDRRQDIHRAIACNTSLREAGRVYGSVPFGCVDVMRAPDGSWQRVPATWKAGDKLDRWLQRDPSTWATRVAIVNRLASGSSLREVRAELLAAGIPSPTGKRQWSLNTLSELHTHHASLAALPLADVTHVATPATAPRDPEVSAHV